MDKVLRALIEDDYSYAIQGAVKVGEAEARGEEPDALHLDMFEGGLRTLLNDERLTAAERDEAVAHVLAERIAASCSDDDYDEEIDILDVILGGR